MKGDRAALIVEHAGFVWRVLIHWGVPRERLEDVSQEVFATALSARFEGRSSFKTFLYGVCRNVALVERRQSRSQTEIPTDELPETVVQPAQEGQLWIKRAHERLLQALELLSDPEREVFVLFEIAELSMDEIATTTSAPLSSCYSRLYSARERVQAELRRRALGPSSRFEAKK